VESWVCVVDRCFVAWCKQGKRDTNGESDDGCEADAPAGGEIWVDAAGGDDTDGDGSAELAYKTLATALSKATPGTRVRLRAGIYAGGAEITVADVRLEGVDGAVVDGPADGVGLLVTASGVQIRGLRVTGARVGVRVEGAEGARIEGVRVDDMHITGLAASKAELGAAVAVEVEHVDGVTLTRLSADDIEGGLGPRCAANNDCTPGDAVGVQVRHADGLLVAGCNISELLGGPGTRTDDTNVNAGAGGSAIGVDAEEASGVSVVGNAIGTLKGTGVSRAGLHGGYAPGGDGGSAIGVHLLRCAGCVVADNTMSTLAGGENEECGPAGGVAGVEALDSPAVEITGNQVTGARAAVSTAIARYANHYCEFTMVDHDGDGIRVTSCDGARIEANVIRGVDTTNSTPAAEISGIRVERSSDCLVLGNLVARVIGSPNTGPMGGPYGPFRGMDATGLILEEVATCTVSNNAIADIRAGPTNQGSVDTQADDGTGACVRISKSTGLVLQHLSCHGISRGGPTGIGGGVLVLDDQEEPVDLNSSVISTVDGACLRSETGSASDLIADHSLLHACTGGQTDNATADKGILDSDPLFRDPDNGDLHLKPGSPAIDAGDPDDPYSAEPAPDGCRVNMGAYGNTSSATSKSGVEHCGGQ